VAKPSGAAKLNGITKGNIADDDAANDWKLSHSAPDRRPKPRWLRHLLFQSRLRCGRNSMKLHMRGQVRAQCNPRLLTPQKFLPAADRDPAFHLPIQLIKTSKSRWHQRFRREAWAPTPTSQA